MSTPDREFQWFDPTTWRSPEGLLILWAAAGPLSFATWMTLLNNFAVERAGFDGTAMGWLQSIREVPGFIAFSTIWLLLLLRERTLAIVALVVLGLGVASTGAFPSLWGLCATTFVMSLGYHYFETVQMSLTLQWIDPSRTAGAFARQISAKAAASIAAYGLVWLSLRWFGFDYATIFAMGGFGTVVLVLASIRLHPPTPRSETQRRRMVVRRSYWLFYALTFMGGARRQIFVVFAGFLLVTRFGFDASTLTALHLANHVASLWFAPRVASVVNRWGERGALTVEYVGLTAVFIGYALVDSPLVAAILFVIDHLFFSFSIAQKSYLQKIADPADIAATSGVSFTINHVAAVVIPAAFGTYLWPHGPELVFYAGAAMAVVSLALAVLVPRRPHRAQPTVFSSSPAA